MQSKVYPSITGPHDLVNTPIIGLCMQEYFLKLLGTYREFVELDEPEEEDSPEYDAAEPNVQRTHQDDGYLRYGSPVYLFTKNVCVHRLYQAFKACQNLISMLDHLLTILPHHPSHFAPALAWSPFHVSQRVLLNVFLHACFSPLLLCPALSSHSCGDEVGVTNELSWN